MIKKIMQRLDEEIKKLEDQNPNNHMYLWGKYVEATYLREIFNKIILEEALRKPQKDEEIGQILHDSWKERIKEREDMTEKPEKSCDTCIHWDKSISHCDFPFTCFSYKWYKSREDKTE